MRRSSFSLYKQIVICSNKLRICSNRLLFVQTNWQFVQTNKTSPVFKQILNLFEQINKLFVHICYTPSEKNSCSDCSHIFRGAAWCRIQAKIRSTSFRSYNLTVAYTSENRILIVNSCQALIASQWRIQAKITF